MNKDELLERAASWLIEHRKAESKLEKDNAKYSATVMVDQWSEFIQELLSERDDDDLNRILQRLPGKIGERPLTLYGNGEIWLIGYSEYGTIVGLEAHAGTPKAAALLLAKKLLEEAA